MKNIARILGIIGLIAVFAGLLAGRIYLHQKARELVRDSVGQKWGNENEKEFADAALTGDEKKLEDLLSKGVKVDCEGNDGVTPLKAAELADSRDAVLLLLKHGADPNLIASDGLAAIHVAALDALCKDPWYLKTMLEHGGNPNLASKRTGDPLIFLLFDVGRVSPEKLKLLAEAGANLNVNAHKLTPLTLTGHRHAFDAVYCLLQQGADPTLKDTEGNTIVDVMQEPIFDKSDCTGDPQQVIDWLKNKNLWKEEKDQGGKNPG